ncbi:MAG: hypothetical protein HY926_01330 [Elusimicrobia bacterium]|nr:hypothetical protein [Elusimicrobiota bacterium]
MYERRHHPLASRRLFLLRLTGHAASALGVILASLSAGVLGYHHWGSLGWTDSLLNASMIMGGMGPVDRLSSRGAKLFASGYALYSGLVLLVSVGIILAPVLHRILHKFHIETGREEDRR